MNDKLYVECAYCQSTDPCYDGFTLAGYPCQHPLRTNMNSDIVAELEKELDRQRHCPTCNAELPFKQYGQKCYACLKREEKTRWDALTIEQKLDELKARMDAAGPAITNAWLHVPLG